MSTLECGKSGEQAVADYISEKGFVILSRNYRSRFGEIDLIGKKDNFLCFIEVKTRRMGQLATGMEAIDAKKQSKIVKTAEHYIYANRAGIEKQNLQPRFDCAEVHVDAKGEVVDIEYLDNAF